MKQCHMDMWRQGTLKCSYLAWQDQVKATQLHYLWMRSHRLYAGAHRVLQGQLGQSRGLGLNREVKSGSVLPLMIYRKQSQIPQHYFHRRLLPPRIHQALHLLPPYPKRLEYQSHTPANTHVAPKKIRVLLQLPKKSYPQFPHPPPKMS